MRGYPGVDSQRSTSRSGSWNGSGRSSTKSASENAAVFAPTPNAITRIAVSVKPGLARNDRPAYRTSCRRISQCAAIAFGTTSPTAASAPRSGRAGPDMSRSRATNVAVSARPNAGDHMMRALERFYRVLLYLYPASFRNEYGRALTATFVARLRDMSGPARPLLGALAAVGDVVPNAIAAHWEILRHDVRYAGRSLRALSLIHISEPTRLLS